MKGVSVIGVGMFRSENIPTHNIADLAGRGEGAIKDAGSRQNASRRSMSARRARHGGAAHHGRIGLAPPIVMSKTPARRAPPRSATVIAVAGAYDVVSHRRREADQIPAHDSARRG